MSKWTWENLEDEVYNFRTPAGIILFVLIIVCVTFGPYIRQEFNSYREHKAQQARQKTAEKHGEKMREMLERNMGSMEKYRDKLPPKQDIPPALKKMGVEKIDGKK